MRCQQGPCLHDKMSQFKLIWTDEITKHYARSGCGPWIKAYFLMCLWTLKRRQRISCSDPILELYCNLLVISSSKQPSKYIKITWSAYFFMFFLKYCVTNNNTMNTAPFQLNDGNNQIQLFPICLNNVMQTFSCLLFLNLTDETSEIYFSNGKHFLYKSAQQKSTEQFSKCNFLSMNFRNNNLIERLVPLYLHFYSVANALI